MKVAANQIRPDESHDTINANEQLKKCMNKQVTCIIIEFQFFTPPWKTNWFEKSGLNLQCLNEEKQLLGRVIGMFEKSRN